MESPKTEQITDEEQISKLGLELHLKFNDYSFAVRYKAISANGKTSISGGRTINVVTSDSVANDKNPCPISDEPTPTPTREDASSELDANESECVVGYTINNEEIYRGIQLKYSTGQLIVDVKEYIPSPTIPTVVYMYLNSVESDNFCGRITINSRNDGISSETFNNTIVSYVHSNGKCYNKDLNEMIGNDNYVVFGEEDEVNATTNQSCCENLQIISKSSNNQYGIQLSDSEGEFVLDPKKLYNFGLPTVVYIYINNYSQHGETFRGRITFQNRVGGLFIRFL